MQDFNDFDDKPDERKAGFIQNLHPFTYIVIVLGIVFFLYQIIGGTLAILSGGDDPSKNVKITRIVLSFGQFMLILAPAIFFTRLQIPDLKQAFRLNIPNPFLVLLAIIGIIFIQPLLQGYMNFQNYILDNLPFFQGFIKELKDLFEMLDAQTLKIVSAYSLMEFFIVVFVIAVTPSICEEILFRGFVLKNFERFTRPSIAIFLSAFLFAVYHFQPLNIIPLIILGIFLAFVVYYSNSIITGIICHFLNNFFAAYVYYMTGKEDIETPHIAASDSANVIIFSIGSLIIFTGVMFLFYKMRTKPSPS